MCLCLFLILKIFFEGHWGQLIPKVCHLVATWWLLGGYLVLCRCGSLLFFYAPCLGREHFFKFERTKAPSLSQLVPTCADLRPIWSNLKLPSANIRQLSTNLGHLGPKWGAGNVQKSLFSIGFCIFSKYRPSCNLTSTWGQLGPTRGQFCANLVPTGGHFGSNFGPTWAN